MSEREKGAGGADPTATPTAASPLKNSDSTLGLIWFRKRGDAVAPEWRHALRRDLRTSEKNWFLTELSVRLGKKAAMSFQCDPRRF